MQTGMQAEKAPAMKTAPYSWPEPGCTCGRSHVYQAYRDPAQYFSQGVPWDAFSARTVL